MEKETVEGAGGEIKERDDEGRNWVSGLRRSASIQILIGEFAQAVDHIGL